MNAEHFPQKLTWSNCDAGFSLNDIKNNSFKYHTKIGSLKIFACINFRIGNKNIGITQSTDGKKGNSHNTAATAIERTKLMKNNSQFVHTVIAFILFSMNE